MGEKNSSNTRSIDRAFDILECFKKDKIEISLVEISEETKLSPSTVHRIIATLEDRKYLERNPENKKYYLGPMIAHLGNLKLSTMGSDFRKIALPYMEKLRDKFNETVSLYVAEGDSRVCVERVETTQQLRRIINIGERMPMYKGATGKLLLSYLPEEKAKRIIGDRSDLTVDDLKNIREKGFTFSNGEREEGVSAIAAPVFDAKNNFIAALSMSGPSVRFINEELYDKIRAVIDCASQISDQLLYV